MIGPAFNQLTSICLGCKVFFTTASIGRFSNEPLLERLQTPDIETSIPDLKTVCLLRGAMEHFITYSEMILESHDVFIRGILLSVDVLYKGNKDGHARVRE